MQNGRNGLGFRTLAVVIALVLILQNIPASVMAAESGGWGSIESNEIDKTGQNGAQTEKNAGTSGDKDESGWNITFLSDGETYAQIRVQENSPIGTLPENPVKEGFRFAYWMNDMGEAVDESFVPSSDMVLYSHFEKTWIVTFKNGGTVAAQIEAADHETLPELPAGPEKAGSMFLGWYTQDGIRASEGMSITENMDFDAKFGYEIAFYASREDEEPIARRTVEEGETIGTFPEEPFRAGSRFVSWVREDDGAAASADMIVDRGMRINGTFEEIEIYTVNVEYYYTRESGEDFTIDTTVVTVDLADVTDENPLQIISPAQFEEKASGGLQAGTVYYPETQTLVIGPADFARADETGTLNYRIKYEPNAKDYSVVYLLKDLEGDGYTEIERVDGLKAVTGSLVTPEKRTYAFADFERTQPYQITEEEGQELSVYYTRKNYNLVFQTDGGSTVDPVSAPYETEISLAGIESSRTGYDFDGWFLDEQRTQPAGETVKLTAGLTVYARWEPRTVNYTIVYMKEKYDNASGTTNYVYDNSETGSAKVGSTVSAADAPKKHLSNAANYRGYEWDSARNASSETVIDADGSSVLMVYYSLIRYTLSFNLNNTGGRIRIAGYEGNSYSLTNIVLGQDVSSVWPCSASEVYDGSNANNKFRYWSGSSDGNYVTRRFEVTWGMVSGANSAHVMTYKANWSTSLLDYAVEYYLQSPDDPSLYEASTVYSQSLSMTSGSTLNPKDLDGYSKHGGSAAAPFGYNGTGNVTGTNEVWVEPYTDTLTVESYSAAPGPGEYTVTYEGRTYTFTGSEQKTGSTGKGWNKQYYTYYVWTYTCTVDGHYETVSTTTKVYRFYYDRNSYHIDYYDGGTKLKTTGEIPFGADISDAGYDYVPSKPAGKEEYTWGGWYEDSTLQTPCTFRTMPGHHLALYANWIPPQYTVSFDPGFEGAESFAPQTVRLGGHAVNPGSPARVHYSFLGWFTMPQGGQEYLFEDQSVEHDLTLYGHWQEDPLQYTVRYLDRESGQALFPEKTVENPVFTFGQEITEEAAVVAGYMVYDSVKTISLSYDPDENLIVFEYGPKADLLHYTVRYVLEDNPAIEVHESAKIDIAGTYASVTEKAASVDPKWMLACGATAEQAQAVYHPTADTKVLQLGLNAESNVIVFTYVPAGGARVNVEWVDMEGAPIEGKSAKTVYCRVGDTFRVDTVVPGYTFESIWDDIHPDHQGSRRYQVENSGQFNIRVYMKKNLTITARNKVKIYDGTSLSSSGTGDVSVTGLAAGDVLTAVEYTGSQTDSGSSPTIPSGAVISGHGENYYAVAYEEGMLTVRPLPVVINVEPDRWNDGPVYDGTPRTIGFRALRANPDGTDGVTISQDLYEQLYGTAIRDMVRDLTLTRTDAGYYTLPASQIRRAIALPEDPNYTVTLNIRDGELTILPAPLTVVTGSAQKNYDGTALTAPEASVTGLASGEQVTVRATGSQTLAGSSENGYEITWDDAKEENYILTEQLGTLTVTSLEDEVVVTVVGHSAAADYDGQAHVVSGYDVTISNPMYTENDFTFTGSARAERTDAGTTPMGLTPEQFVNTNEGFANVVFRVTDGFQTIRPIAVAIKITGHHGTASYDGEPHSVVGYEFTSDSSLYDADDFVFNGTAAAVRTEEGTTPMGLASELFENKNPNFEPVFEVTDGYMTITAAKEVVVTITGHGSTADYNGAAHSVSGYDVRISSPLYTEDDFIFNGSAQASRVNAGTTMMGLDASQFVNTNKNFEGVVFQVEDGYQTVNPIDVTVDITGRQNEAVYDGLAHTAAGYSAAISSPLYTEADFTFSGSASASRTDAGTTPMGLAAEQFANTNENFRSVLFRVTDGYQTILPASAAVTITGHFNVAAYDGTEHTVQGYDAVSGSALYSEEDFIFTGSASASRTNAGTTPMGLTAEQFVNTNSNFANVTFTVTDGYETIVPAEEIVVTLRGRSASAVYDGAAHSVSGYDVEISSPLYTEADFTFSGSAFVSRTDAGTTAMGLDTSQFVNTNENFKNVSFVVVDGYQTILPASVTVTIIGHQAQAVYDGNPHDVAGFDVQTDSPLYTAADFIFNGTAGASRTDAGTTAMGLDASQFVNTNANFDNIVFVVTDGSMNIAPADAAVVITGHGNTAVYDGKAHEVSGYNVVCTPGLYTEADFTFAGSAVAVRTDEGITPMGLTAEQFVNTNRNFANVTFTVTDGYQEIVPVENVTVTIRGRSAAVDYDAQEHSVIGYDVEISSPLFTEADFIFTGSAKASGVDAGTTMMGLDETQFVSTNENFKNVVFKVTDGWLTINPVSAAVTVTGRRSSVNYDGKEHTVSGYDVTISNPLYTEEDFTFTGTAGASRTNAGTTPMGLDASQFANTNANFNNVVFTVADGWQNITPVDVTVTITGTGGAADYDGQEHSVQGYKAEISGGLYTEDDFVFNGNAAAARTDAGTTAMGLDPSQFVNINENFRSVTFEVTDGSMTIRPVSAGVVIRGRTATAVYDGAEHTVTGYDFETDNALYTENDFTFTGNASASRTEEGTTQMGLDASQFANTNTNFKDVTFVVTDGWQNITGVDEVIVTITGHSTVADYDGREHSASGYDMQISNPLYKETDFTFSGVDQVARTNAGTTEMGLDASQFENTNRNFKNVSFIITDGFVTVLPIDVTVTVTGHTNAADYDGSEHSADGYDVSFSSRLYTASDFTFDGAARAARTDAGKTPMGLNASQFTNTNDNFRNVDFEVTDGWQLIHPIDVNVTITGHVATVDYDGAVHTVSGYDVLPDNALYTEEDFTFTGSASASRKDAGTTPMGLGAHQFANINGNFRSVVFDVQDGRQIVNPIDVEVTITGHVSSVDYDGAVHGVSGYDVEISDPLYTENDFVFTGSASASRTNAGTTQMGLEAGMFANTNKNFSSVIFDVTDGYQTVNPIDVTVTVKGHTSTVTYDGDLHSVEGYEAEADTGLYTADDFVFSGRAYAERTRTGITHMNLDASQFENVNTNFASVTFDVTDGYQEIVPLDAVVVTITGHHAVNDYDGEKHSVSGYDAEISSPLYTEKDFTFTGSADAQRTDAGTTQMGLAAEQFTNINTDFSNVVFRVEDGYQIINPIDAEVTITGHADVRDYDGEEHSVSGYDTVISNPLYTEEDFNFTGSAQARRTDAGTTQMGLAAEQFVNRNENFRSVTFRVTDGYQTINPIDVEVKITGHADARDYDGAVHSVSGYDAEISSPLYTEEDFAFEGTAEAVRKDAGTTPMGLAAEQFVNTNSNFRSVSFHVADGYQTIRAIPVTVLIQGHFDVTAYDGEEHSVEGYDMKASTDLYTEEDFAFAGSAQASRVDAGTTPMGMSAAQFSNTSANFRDVEFLVTDGYQTIVPVDEVVVTITGHTAVNEYNGREHSVSGYDVAISNPLYKESDFSFTGISEAQRTDAGTTMMGLAAAQFENTSGNFTGVVFNVTDGFQTVSPVPAVVRITGHNETADYDGGAHTAEGYDVQSDSPLYTENDFTFSGTAMAVRVNAGTTMMGLAAAQFENVNSNFSGVTFIVEDGCVTISPIDARVHITGHRAAADYDGQTHTVIGYDMEASTPLYTEKDFVFMASARASGVDAGTVMMELAPEQFENINSNFRSVEFTVTDGYQLIRPADVTVYITGHKDTQVYDGQMHSVIGYDYVSGNPIYTEADFEFLASARADRVDAGTTSMDLAPAQFENINSNFRNVEFVVEDGYQRILPREVLLSSLSAQKEYDGTPLTDESVMVDGDGFADGEGADYHVTGSQLLPGSSENTFTYTLAEGTKAENYDIYTSFGTLAVVSRQARYAVEVEANSGVFTYDGQTKTVSGLGRENSGSVSASRGADTKQGAQHPVFFVIDGIRYTLLGLQASASAASVGEYPVNVTGMPIIMDAFGNIVTDQFAVTVKSGTMTINPAVVTVRAEDKTKTAGTADPVLTAAVEGLHSGDPLDTISYTLSRESGEAPGSYRITPAGAKRQGNYEVRFEPGTLTITSSAPAQTYNLTINYLYGDGKTAAPSWQGTFRQGASYLIVSPQISGFAADRSVVSGTMPGQDLTIDVIYTGQTSSGYRRPVTLTVRYLEGTREVFRPFRGVYDSGSSYHVLSPVLNGCSADQAAVSGTITQDTTIDVHYTRNTYSVTVRYIYPDGTPAADPVTITVSGGESYRVSSPALAGYVASSRVVTGVMGGRNKQVTVVYLPVSGPGSSADVAEDTALTIDDYQTPLGVGATTVNAGESYE